jgi:tRNA (cmo5U34)-methyltransferase
MKENQVLEPMAAFFNKRAESYDEVHTSHIGGGRESKDIVARYLPAHTRDVLDLGCGTGLELEALFNRFPGAKVLGIDMAQDMLALLRERCAGRNVQTLCMSYFDYAFPQQAFDAVISVMSLHHLAPDQKLALYRQARGALRPGGVFLNCDYYISSAWRERRNFKRLRQLGYTPGKMHFDTPLTADRKSVV